MKFNAYSLSLSSLLNSRHESNSLRICHRHVPPSTTCSSFWQACLTPAVWELLNSVGYGTLNLQQTEAAAIPACPASHHVQLTMTSSKLSCVVPFYSFLSYPIRAHVSTHFFKSILAIRLPWCHVICQKGTCPPVKEHHIPEDDILSCSVQLLLIMVLKQHS
jgi:hypothetical protein